MSIFDVGGLCPKQLESNELEFFGIEIIKKTTKKYIFLKRFAGLIGKFVEFPAWISSKQNCLQ